MWIAILVLVASSLMLVSVYVRGWIPAVDAIGGWLFLAPIAWGLIAIPMTLFAPPWIMAIWIGSIWAGPIVIFLVDAAMRHPIDLIFAAPLR